MRRGKAWHSQEEGQLHFLPACSFPILGQFVSPWLCQPHSTSLPGLLGTHVAPAAGLGNEDSGNVHLRSLSVPGSATGLRVRVGPALPFTGIWRLSAPSLARNQPAQECGQTEPMSAVLVEPSGPCWGSSTQTLTQGGGFPVCRPRPGEASTWMENEGVLESPRDCCILHKPPSQVQPPCPWLSPRALCSHSCQADNSLRCCPHPTPIPPFSAAIHGLGCGEQC